MMSYHCVCVCERVVVVVDSGRRRRRLISFKRKKKSRRIARTIPIACVVARLIDTPICSFLFSFFLFNSLFLTFSFPLSLSLSWLVLFCLLLLLLLFGRVVGERPSVGPICSERPPNQVQHQSRLEGKLWLCVDERRKRRRRSLRHRRRRRTTMTFFS